MTVKAKKQKQNKMKKKNWNKTNQTKLNITKTNQNKPKQTKKTQNKPKQTKPKQNKSKQNSMSIGIERKSTKAGQTHRGGCTRRESNTSEEIQYKIKQKTLQTWSKKAKNIPAIYSNPQ